MSVQLNMLPATKQKRILMQPCGIERKASGSLGREFFAGAGNLLRDILVLGSRTMVGAKKDLLKGRTWVCLIVSKDCFSRKTPCKTNYVGDRYRMLRIGSATKAEKITSRASPSVPRLFFRR